MEEIKLWKNYKSNKVSVLRHLPCLIITLCFYMLYTFYRVHNCIKTEVMCEEGLYDGILVMCNFF